MNKTLLDQHNEKSLRIAIIGCGVAGITAAHILQRKHQVTMFEKNNVIGGHTNTVMIDNGPDEGTPVDTGFIVLNDRTYPTFHKLLAQFNVSTRDSDMSFGFHCEKSGMQYSGRGFAGLFADSKNVWKPTHWKMIRDIFRFNNKAHRDLHENKIQNMSLDEYIKKEQYSDAFCDHYLIPMGAAIWSTPADEMLTFPAETLLRFFDNHGLLTVANRPQWQTVVGGSHSYIKSFLHQFNGKIETNCSIKYIIRNGGNGTIYFHDRETQTFDRIIIAVHADQVLPLLADPTEEEQNIFSKWKYNKNHTVLHTDDSVMPPKKNAWASWNYTRENIGTEKEPLSLTYDMNRLQGLNTHKRYFVTLNRKKQINPNTIIREIDYMHPLFTQDAISTQSHLKLMAGKKYTYYCGSYFGFGFHEDAVKSAVALANAMGLEL